MKIRKKTQDVVKSARSKEKYTYITTIIVASILMWYQHSQVVAATHLMIMSVLGVVQGRRGRAVLRRVGQVGRGWVAAGFGLGRGRVTILGVDV